MTVHQGAHPNEAEKIEPAEVISFLIAFLMQTHKGGGRGGGGGVRTELIYYLFLELVMNHLLLCYVAWIAFTFRNL